MKKTYVYFLVPILGLVAFAAVYWNFNRTYEAKLADRQRVIREQKEEKLRLEAKSREKAIQDALAAQEKRKAEKAAKEAKDQKDQEERQAAIEASRKADRDQQKLSLQVKSLQEQIKTEKDAIAKIQEEQKLAIEEQAFLKNYVKQAQSNQKSLNEVIDKIVAADAAKAAADALAAAKAKNS
jgi:colicin import membrane protein